MVAEQAEKYNLEKVKVLNGNDRHPHPETTNGMKTRVGVDQEPSHSILGDPPRNLEMPMCYTGPNDLMTKNFPGTSWQVSAAQNIGNRRTQEDRYCICPRLVTGRDECSFFGVFDGTVGDFASDNIKDIITPELMKSPHWQHFVDHVLPQNREVPDGAQILEKAVRDMYLSADKLLVWACSQQEKHYATCTSVTAILAGGYLAIAHLGDSRIILGVEEADGSISGEQATEDHKPDQQSERQRIEAHGGSVEYLRNHQNKPFIRGGDFTRRKALGEQPMQIQYSRAFGGKDLKMFGLSNEPSVKILRPKRQQKPVRWIILASDGLWDVCDHKEAIQIVTAAQREQTTPGQSYNSPAQALVQHALSAQKSNNNNADNVTAVAIYIPRA
eukprot:gnl/MRDRNA2_/MRDRNA2_155180_c0_seq1.p1 gnl/MRDRNA2_/MRDRNA2_155180_c0~~gnl/MRDRNA2_/MRDRNA2_155180_c0_seq1.p1  ORF type:complete len:386 (-),score=52.23 gnl/MRDRNA2_/MRDRNA2_155180_c0_seq1:43-1200(-)